MAHSILSVKLRELDREVSSIHRRIHLAEADPPPPHGGNTGSFSAHTQ